MQKTLEMRNFHIVPFGFQNILVIVVNVFKFVMNK